MREPVDPPRLFDDRSEATRALREGLEALRKELPSEARTEAVLHGVQRALVRPASATAARTALSGKWLSALVLGGALGLGVYGLRSMAPRAPHEGPVESAAATPSTVEHAPRVLALPPRAGPDTPLGAPGAPSVAPARPEREPDALGAAPLTAPDPAPAVRSPAAVHAPVATAMPQRVPARTARFATSGATDERGRSSVGHGSGTRHRGATVSAEDGSASRATASDRGARDVDELGLIRAAQVALRSSPARALTLLAQHQKLAPDGALAEEREVLELDALGALGRPRTSEAQGFLARYPRSLHAARVRSMLNDAR
jgi:hypothetical protein